MDINIVSAMLYSMALVLVALSIAFVLLLLKIFTGKSLRTSKYPPVHGTVFGQIIYFSRLYDYQTGVARRSPTFRLLAPDQSEIYTVDTRNVEHILKTKFEEYTKGEYNIDIAKDLFGEGIFAVDGDKWRKQRKVASFEFATRVLRDFSCCVFRKNAAKLVKVVEELSAASEIFDMQDILMRCTLDSIFKVGFGVELNCLEGSSKEGRVFMKAFDEANALIYWRYVDPSWKLKRLLNIGSEARLRNNIKLINNFVDQLIRTKRNQLPAQRERNDKEDILSRFLLESEKDPENMNDKYLRDVILNFMIAGKDTSANTLSWFLYMLCKHPLVQQKIFDEIKEVIGDQVSEANADYFVEKITDLVLDRMYYLHATLTETLRLYPAVPADGRCAEADDVLPDGFHVKKGDGVYFLAYSMGRMHNIWGEDAEDFKPERWLKDGIFQNESPFKFVAFNAGPRICLGKDFAYRQMKIVSIALLRFFRFRLADETRPVTYKVMFTLHIDNGLHLHAVPRLAA
ncbi:cytochrome P450 704C1-like isoform X1 [Syzygium oleosum]|uniref:cytochrome P450 704C1-like isoform X1 n=1 Tax=Syzygium oleosum TaxID=219896 RepID=UPI0024B9471B|nr:cytochrome P450 704C1-like isoform X1 [Syzygium oleosum]